MSQAKQGMARFLEVVGSLPRRLVPGWKPSGQNGESDDPRLSHKTRYVKEVIEHSLGQTFVFTSDPTQILPEYLYLSLLAESTYEDYRRELLSDLDDSMFAWLKTVSGKLETRNLSRLFIMPYVYRLGEDLKGRETEKSAVLAHELLKLPERQVLLLGNPGSGKSMLMSFMALMLAQNQPYRLGLPKDTHWLPILIRVRHLDPTLSILESLQKVTASRFQSLGAGLPNDFFMEWLKSGNVLILVDGLDEASHQDETINNIGNFLDQFPKNRAILTSRSLHHLQARFTNNPLPVYELQPFDSDQIDSFIDRWYDRRILAPEEARLRGDDLRQFLKQQPHIQEIVGYPLMLTLIAIIHRQGLLSKLEPTIRAMKEKILEKQA